MAELAIYPGSFDPPTLGHLDVIERAATLFPQVRVAIGMNSGKQAPFLPVESRLRALRAMTANLPNVSVDQFDGLLVQYAKSQGAEVIIRGLRLTADFDYEFQIALANRRLDPDVETLFLMTKWEHSYLSSSIVREVARLGGDYSGFVHPEVAAIIAAELGDRS